MTDDKEERAARARDAARHASRLAQQAAKLDVEAASAKVARMKSIADTSKPQA